MTVQACAPQSGTRTVGETKTNPQELQDKHVYVFGSGKADGDATQKQLLGGKGAYLNEMCRIGLRVPPGFTIATTVCKAFHAEGGQVPEGVWQEVLQGVAQVEGMMGLKFGDAKDPLLLSIRSGAAVSMPGMMDTVLNLGLNDAAARGLAAVAGERFAWDTYRRFLDLFASVVLGVEHDRFEELLAAMKEKEGAKADVDLSAGALQELVAQYKRVYDDHGTPFPADPYAQLRAAIGAVFQSWEGGRAVAYRQVNGIKGLVGTAVNVQAMVYGNRGANSGTGVCFTRNPATGEAKLYGEYLVNAQGEDVVAGLRTPEPIARLAEQFPEAHTQLVDNCNTLERHFCDMMDIEFTVQEGALYMLQCRSGKRTGAAAVAIAVAMVQEGLVDEARAVDKLVEPRHLAQLLHPQFKKDEGHAERVLGKGLPASPGAAVGKIVFSSAAAEAAAAAGEAPVLLRRETSPEDVKGMHAAAGVLTQRGGMTSHAAVVARGWGKPCITGCGELSFDDAAGTAALGGVTLREGDVISLDGATGEVVRGALDVEPPSVAGGTATFMAWADKFRKLGVMANADTPEDVAQAIDLCGAEGVGLVRTEHMFFATEARIAAVRKMILTRGAADAIGDPLAALKPIEDFQRQDFIGILRAAGGRRVTVRLLDPPLHEFLPSEDDEKAIGKLAGDVGMSADGVRAAVRGLREVNPMLGLRGCRLTIAYPEIAATQVRAVVGAALAVAHNGAAPRVDIMIPLVSTPEELRHQAALVRATAAPLIAQSQAPLELRVGTMVETPRAALLAGELAKEADFFSFGSNDLTQMTYGFSRDDVGRFLPTYLKEKILPDDPFQVLDPAAVGELIRSATAAGRAAKPGLSVGLCGEHGGDAASVALCAAAGLDYVSCSPLRVPVARLAAAQAALRANAAAA